ncbi:hypothetical protein BJ166DRAFT_526416 [Pestalotiopsis sp. NC0098]|nr:hypothetical protein BJ166DRAFT_526416 [Pestalotiopsis sp. NC0098]
MFASHIGVPFSWGLFVLRDTSLIVASPHWTRPPIQVDEIGPCTSGSQPVACSPLTPTKDDPHERVCNYSADSGKKRQDLGTGQNSIYHLVDTGSSCQAQEKRRKKEDTFQFPVPNLGIYLPPNS